MSAVPSPSTPVGGGAIAPSARGRHLNLLESYAEIRARYLQLGLAVAVSVQLVGLMEFGAPLGVRLVRGACAGCCGIGLLLGRRSSMHLGRVMISALWLAMVAAAWLRLPEGWPPDLLQAPALVVFGTLVAGHRLVSVLTALSVGAIATSYLSGRAALPPYFAVQFTNWALAMVLLHLFVRQYQRVLTTGAAELSTTTDAFTAAQRAAEELSVALSSRVAGAVDALRAAVERDPLTAGPAAEHVVRTLTACRSAVPPEPELPDPRLGDRLEELRRRAIGWTFQVALALSVMQLVRNISVGTWEGLVASCLTTTLSGVSLVIRARHPVSGPSLNAAFVALTYPIMSVSFIAWLARGVNPVPSLVTWLMGAVVVAVTIGPRAAFVLLAVSTSFCLGALPLGSSMSWTFVVNLALVYCAVGWILSRWPQDLLESLLLHRDAAAARLRDRSRMVATLFHDLANPMQVIQFGLESLAEGVADDGEELERTKSMAGRMRATLDAALRGKVELRAVPVGRLCQELQSLFRERLRQKRIEVRMSGSSNTRVRCDEALLRDSVLANLMSNALKFSPQGATVELSVVSEASRVGLVLEDRGPGLPTSVLEAVKRGKKALSSAGSAGETGNGYGLMLARDYVMAMGGDLELASREGGGLSAKVWLPAA